MVNSLHNKNRYINFGLGLISIFASLVFNTASANFAPNSAVISATVKHENYALMIMLRETRLNRSVDLESIEATVGERTLKLVDFTRNYKAPDAPPAHFLFLVDTSITMRGAPIKQSIELIANLVRQLPDNAVYSVASFDKSLITWIDKQPRKLFESQQLNKLEAQGKVTELYRLVLETAKNMVGKQSVRPTIIILSDGRIEDTSYSDQDVIDFAVNNGVVLHGLAFNYTAESQSLRRLAEATGGVFSEVNEQGAISDEALQYIQHSTVNGGIATFDLGPYDGNWGIPATINITYTFENGFTSKNELMVTLPQRPWLEIPYKGYPRLWWFIAGAGIFVLLILFYLVIKKRALSSDSDLHEGVEGEQCSACNKIIEPEWKQCHYCGSPISSTDEAIAQLTRVNNALTETYPITKATTSIGRLADNDIVLNEDTVGRWHANIMYKDDGFHLQDLGSVNTVLLNNEVVTASTPLSHGDEIDIGGIIFRFEINVALKPIDATI